MNNLKKYSRFYVHKNRVDKFAVYNKCHNFHLNGVNRYANIGNDHLLPEVHDLPKDGYPYTTEYSDKRLRH